MIHLKDFTDGCEFIEKVLEADLSGNNAQSDIINNQLANNQIHLDNEHITAVNEAIDELTKNLNELEKKHNDIKKLKGFVAEEWHAGTFNIDAISKNSADRAWRLDENGFGSVDVDTNFGKQYGLKYYATPEQAEKQQAWLDVATKSPKYHGQERLIAYEQLEEAKSIARKREIKDMLTRPEVSASHKETREHLVGVISHDEVSSKPLSIKESEQIAKEVNKNGFNAEKHGFVHEDLIEELQIDYIDQAMKAGLTAASISAITQLIPELFKAIDYLEKNGEIDINSLKKSGVKVMTSSAESFLLGSTTYLVESAILNGLFGETIKVIDSSIVGATVSIIYRTLKNSILVATNQMTPQQMGAQFVDNIIVTSGYLVGKQIGGLIGQSLCPELPIIGYAIGSLLACTVAITYQIGKKQFISFCVDSGFTCFGLVEQNYELPEQALNELGIEYAPIMRTEIETTDVTRIPVNQNIQVSNLETVDIKVLKRGIIGVNKIGYTY